VRHSCAALALAVTGILGACAADPDPDPGPLAPPPPGEGFQLDEGAFTAAAGQEGLYCMRMPIPPDYGDAPVFVHQIESRLPTGTHHFFMAYRTDAVPAQQPCYPQGALVPITEADAHAGGGGKMLFLSGEGAYSYTLPAGYSLYLPTGLGHLVTSHHIFNATESDLAMYGVFNIHTTRPDAITHPVNTLNCLLQDIWIAPHSEQTVSATCTAPFDLDLVVLSSHAHQHLTRFELQRFDGTATVGDPLYTSTDWDSPNIVTLDQPLSLRAGEGLTFRCTFANDSDEPLIFGTGDHGEMCAIMSGYAFPTSRPLDIPPSLGTIIYREGDSAPLIETTDLDGPF
jgi:hypothetical protein